MNTRKDNNGKAMAAWRALGPAVIVHPLRYARGILHGIASYTAADIGLAHDAKHLARRTVDAAELVKLGDGMAAKALARYADKMSRA